MEITLEDDQEMEVNEASDAEDMVLEELLTDTFTPRSYQIELFEIAKKKNSILVLGTGSGKTFISILLIKELAGSIRGKFSEKAKRSVFVVNTVPLVYQQAKAIEQHTGFTVGRYEGSMGVDIWTPTQWKAELEKYEVLVIVAEIFHQLILCNNLPLSQVNLIIMDECHHATGNHPMREIMRVYADCKQKKLEVPKILGLTACVIHKKVRPIDVEKHMNSLEAVMDSALVTSKDQACVKKHSTNAKEMFIECQETICTDTFKYIRERIIELDSEMRRKIEKEISIPDKNVKKKITKSMLKHLKGILDVSNDLGDYILPKAIKMQSEYLINAEADNFIEQNLMIELADKLNQLYSACSSNHVDDPLTYLSGKVRRLLEILGRRQEDWLMLIFVTRRNTAKLLCSLLLELKNIDPALTTLLPESVVGGNCNAKFDLKVSQEEIKKQKETIDRFRKRTCNLIVSTSVLEEGIDIRSCNLVIRFDEPLNYRSYIQSLGRARADPSCFILMSYEKNKDDTEQAVQCYKAINRHLTNLCYDRALPSIEVIKRNFEEDEIEPPYAPYGVPGPQVTFNSAIQLINRYCGTLPQDKFTKLSVAVDKWTSNNKFYVRLTLPMNAPCKLKITGNPMQNWEDAKKSSALAMCVELHKRGLLDNHLLPKRAKTQAEESLAKYIRLEEEEILKGKPGAGTKKRRQVYKRRICRSFRGKCNSDLYLHLIYFQHIISVEDGLNLDSDGTYSYLGLLTAEKLDCSAFPLYSKKWGEVNVIVEPLKRVSYESDLMKDVKMYHRLVSELLLHLNSEIMAFNPNKLGHTVFIVPLTRHKEIDVNQMKALNRDFDVNHCSKDQKRMKIDTINSYKFEAARYENYIISPSYRKQEMFYVHKVLYELSPLSEFPESKHKFASYKDYVKQTYDVDVTTDDQPLLDCKHFSKEFNYLPLKEATIRERVSRHPKFIPELCVVFPLLTTLWCQMLCMASILHRINGLMLEQELYHAIGYRACEEEEKKFRSRLDYSWCEESERVVEGSRNDNLALTFSVKTRMDLYPGMILQAFTPLSTKENFNLERLEILGDSYLKYSTGRFLFFKESSSHEGTLSLQRSQLVCNKTLYSLAKKKGIDTMYQGTVLVPNMAIPYGFEVTMEDENLLKEKKINPQEWASYSKSSATDDARQGEVFEMPYNPWSEQLVADKCIADSVEALIGVYLLAGGEKAAIHVMHWLGLSFMKEDIPVPKTALIFEVLTSTQTEEEREFHVKNRPSVYRSINDIYYKNCLDRLENILHYKFNDKSFLIQAVTHPSYTNNKITDCYQRLEFLGDAVLDYLITCYIYSTYRDYSPGRLTDLRSHYVKNETLAKVAVKFGLHKYILHMAHKLGSTIDQFIQMIDENEKEFNTEDDTLVAEDVEVPKVLGDVVESLIGAVYMDSGSSLEMAWQIVKYLLADEFKATKTNIPIDCVRELYERDANVVLEIHGASEDSPAKCIVMMEGYPNLTGIGKNRRTAKQSAAKLALAHLNSQPRAAS